eukprot:6987387-Pyramimonas_sp.AAC.1
MASRLPLTPTRPVKYDPECVPALVRVLRMLLSGKRRPGKPSPFALICTTLRQESTLKLFIEASMAAGLQVRA